jgi:beta-lactamase superfamily II metal-dependent hydrolase
VIMSLHSMLERKSRKMNYSGIILYVQGSSGNVVLSGDSLPVQTKQVLMSRMLYEGNPQCVHHLVVPHHGGD